MQKVGGHRMDTWSMLTNSMAAAHGSSKHPAALGCCWAADSMDSAICHGNIAIETSSKGWWERYQARGECTEVRCSDSGQQDCGQHVGTAFAATIAGSSVKWQSLKQLSATARFQ